MGGVRSGPGSEGPANTGPASAGPASAGPASAGPTNTRPPAAGQEGGPAPETVHSHAELVALLAEQFARADVSLRELQARADRAGGTRLPRATCADMLAGRRFPRKAVMVAFLRACQVPEERLPAWERAWERVRLARMPATAAGEAGTAGDAGPVAGPVAGPAPKRRRTPLLLLVAALVAVAIASTITAVAWTSGRNTRTDDGRAFGPGGSSSFTMRIDPAGGPVRLIRRLDAQVSRQRAAITVNGVSAGHWEPLPDGAAGWADQHLDLPPSLTAGRGSLTVATAFVSSEWDFNEFGYTVGQQSDGAWTTTDTLDVGPAHTGAEAAHGYRITGETFRGTRTLDAPPEADGRAAPRVRYEAEAGRVNHARVRPGAVGASQGTVVAGLDHPDSFVDLRVYAPRTGRFTAHVTYAAGYGDAQHAVTVNGSTRFTLDYLHHGWDVWRQVTASLPLTRGWNTLRLQYHNRWAELDHVEIA
ncbi:hypothetical protein FXF51_21490 [Nonomuraea sp. PA05]|uniref:CBM35 domain-containing protein n=1 Tax=Nonomuraea sp. PA05 TaxID=2604466 RepID=UPI0011D99895|nr:CBM35 domain-containing protein [Nonomuraea sp. PA05]TYB64304.1 hypothetical protein FXF51_21490 [Nonomuraea sp. PA05]